MEEYGGRGGGDITKGHSAGTFHSQSPAVYNYRLSHHPRGVRGGKTTMYVCVSEKREEEGDAEKNETQRGRQEVECGSKKTSGLHPPPFIQATGMKGMVG